MVFDVLVFEVELETAIKALVLGLYLNIASFMKRAALYVAKIFLFSISGDLNIFIAIGKFHLDLGLHCKLKFLFCQTSEIDMIENINLKGFQISDFDFEEEALIFNFTKKNLEGYGLILGMDLMSNGK